MSVISSVPNTSGICIISTVESPFGNANTWKQGDLSATEAVVCDLYTGASYLWVGKIQDRNFYPMASNSGGTAVNFDFSGGDASGNTTVMFEIIMHIEWALTDSAK